MTSGNMDDQYREMKLFQQQLIEFNMRLHDTMRDLEQRHEHVSPMWQDEMRKHYDLQWEPLYQGMKRYQEHDARAYVEFLTIKLHALERYLRG